MRAPTSFGSHIKNLRRDYGISQVKLADRAGIALRTLQYWESEQHSPCEAELESVLQALGATPTEKMRAFTLLTTPRASRMIREATWNPVKMDFGPLPGLGDLLRAMRLRKGWTQGQVAAALRIQRETVNRWETGDVLPSAENLARISDGLNARPDEKQALLERRLLLSEGKSELSFEECRERVYKFVQYPLQAPVADLHALALMRQLHLHLAQAPEALPILAVAKTEYGNWLRHQDRLAESETWASRALAMLRDVPPHQGNLVGTLNLVAVLISKRPTGNADALALIGQWLPRTPDSQHFHLLCDMALFAVRAGKGAEADALLRRAYRELRRAKVSHGGYEEYYRITYGRILMSSGKTVEALKWFPSVSKDAEISPRCHAHVMWAMALLDAGETGAAAQHLTALASLLAVNPFPHLLRTYEKLSQRI